MLTARGWMFFLAILGTLALGLVLETATLILVGLTLLVWFLGAWLLFAVRLRLLSRSLRVEREVWDERGPIASLWAQSSFGVRVRLYQDRHGPAPYVRVRERVPFNLQLVSGSTREDGLPAPGKPLTLRYEVFCPAPGLVRFEGLSILVADLQGFFFHALAVADVRFYRILPPLADVHGHIPVPKRHNLLPLLGTHRLRRPGTGSELLDLRDYLPGDPPKTIAWKASARRDRLMTKVFESEIPVRCTLFVDTSNSVRVGTAGSNALARLAEIGAAVAQASTAVRDLTGLCLFDEHTTRVAAPARTARHLVHLFHLLAEAAALAPSTGEVTVDRLLPLAYALAREIYPQDLDAEVNHFPWWLGWLSPQPAYTLRVAPLRSAGWPLWPLNALRRGARYVGLSLRQAILARVSPRRRTQYRWRKQLAALLSVRYGLAPGGLALLLEDDERCAWYLQRFLADHHVPYELPFYDEQGRYLFAAPGKAEVLAGALLRAVRRGRDNELFVLLADFLEIVDHLGPVLAAVKVARARHHQLIVVCPWPPGVPPPSRTTLGVRREAWGVRREASGVGTGTPHTSRLTPHAPRPTPHASAAGQRAALRLTTAQRFDLAFHQVRGAFARLGVPVVCARDVDAVALILSLLERLRVQERGAL
jgi:uncharacterized protein (DUF58 family)